MAHLTHCSMCGAKSTDLSNIWPEPESLSCESLSDWEKGWMRKLNIESRLWDGSVRSLGSGCVVCELIFSIFLSVRESRDGARFEIGASTRLNCRILAPGWRYLLSIDGLTRNTLDLKEPSGDHNTIIITPLVNGFPSKKYEPCDIPANSNSPGTLKVAKRWLDVCRETHSPCAFREERYVPSRLLDVSDYNPKLVLRAEVQRFEFIALSHCWGGSQPITTQAGNLKRHREEINLGTLPKTFQDAIKVTKSLGFRYLWIDSLCIIQDDKEDWERESSEMDKIYSNAELVPAAAVASSAYDGFLRDRSTPPIGHVIVSPNPRTTPLEFSYRLILDEIIDDEDNPSLDDPLEKRAWAFQEKYLARRYLAYRSEEMTWACREGQSCESSIFFAHKLLIDNIYNVYKLLNTESIPIHDSWRIVLEKFAARALTVPSDKFVAFSAIASYFQSRYGCTYLAGLWEDGLIYWLLWEAHGKPQDIYAPSWSWASVDCNQFNFVSFWNLPPIAHIMEASITSSTANIFVPVSDGLIRLRGKLIQGTLHEENRRGGYLGFRYAPKPNWSELSGCDSHVELDTLVVAFEHVSDDPIGRMEVFGRRIFPEELGLHHVCPASYSIWILPMVGRKATIIGLVLGPSPKHPGCFERLGLVRMSCQTSWEEISTKHEDSEIMLV
ncbi:hypothetical protein M434DRAFT_35537 [Hypoxylon sp. CO27-5]|nr:hypothetical protein M434DRAFT_35537 [Hypoxylon sp. CO27-5]